MFIYKKRLRFPAVGYYGLFVALMFFMEVLSHLDEYNSLSPFYFVTAIILVSIMLLLVMNNIFGCEYLAISNDKLTIRIAFVKKTFLLSSYSNFRIVDAGSRQKKYLVGNENATRRDIILIPQYRSADRVESILDMILHITANKEHSTDSERN